MITFDHVVGYHMSQTSLERHSKSDMMSAAERCHLFCLVAALSAVVDMRSYLSCCPILVSLTVSEMALAVTAFGYIVQSCGTVTLLRNRQTQVVHIC